MSGVKKLTSYFKKITKDEREVEDVDTLYQYIIYRSTSYNPFYNQRTEHLVVG